MSGFFITFEGIDGCGKTTQAQILMKNFSALNIDHLYVREPGGTTISENIRTLLLDNAHAIMGARTELLLFAAARAQIVDEVITPALQLGKAVICDRYTDSTAAFQGYGRELDYNLIQSAIQLATQGLEPHLTFLFDLDLDTAKQRRNNTGKLDDRLESEEIAFHQRVRKGYLQLARDHAHRFVVIDALKPVETQEKEIWKITQIFAKRAGFELEESR
ncbi:MAG: dTMP kinase [Deferribacteres bacterium]|nr:dTMP kinase [candidate division KSB1 bacterium]MCB9502815.1 dTMP kinase [Deferribacteres bacterium]